MPNGCSRVELNGTSLVNPPMRMRSIRSSITCSWGGGVMEANMINTLSYCQGQRRRLGEQIKKINWSQADKNAIEISTVDSLQGKGLRLSSLTWWLQRATLERSRKSLRVTTKRVTKTQDNRSGHWPREKRQTSQRRPHTRRGYDSGRLPSRVTYNLYL